LPIEKRPRTDDAAVVERQAATERIGTWHLSQCGGAPPFGGWSDIDAPVLATDIDAEPIDITTCSDRRRSAKEAAGVPQAPELAIM